MSRWPLIPLWLWTSQQAITGPGEKQHPGLVASHNGSAAPRSRQFYGPQAFLLRRPAFLCASEREHEVCWVMQLWGTLICISTLENVLCMHASVYILISLFVRLPVCGWVNAVDWMSVCVCVSAGLNTAQSTGDNKEFVVGLECPKRLELWQLQHSRVHRRSPQLSELSILPPRSLCFPRRLRTSKWGLVWWVCAIVQSKKASLPTSVRICESRLAVAVVVVGLWCVCTCGWFRSATHTCLLKCIIFSYTLPMNCYNNELI